MERHARAVDRRVVSVPDLLSDARHAHVFGALARSQRHCLTDLLADRQSRGYLQRGLAADVSAVRDGNVCARLPPDGQLGRGVGRRSRVCVCAISHVTAAAYSDAGDILGAVGAAWPARIHRDRTTTLARAVCRVMGPSGRVERIYAGDVLCPRWSVGVVVCDGEREVARADDDRARDSHRGPAARTGALQVHQRARALRFCSRLLGDPWLQCRHRGIAVRTTVAHVLGMGACEVRTGR